MIELKAGQATAPRKVMANSVFGVVKGSGTTEVEGTTLSWSRGDVIVVPSWHEHVHRSDDGAVLFRVTDEPVMREARLPARGQARALAVGRPRATARFTRPIRRP